MSANEDDWDGAYIYAIKPDDTLERRSVQVAATQDGRAVIEQGVSPGDRVVGNASSLTISA